MSETPREFYLRAVIKRGALEVILGLEFDPIREDVEELRFEMKKMANREIDWLGGSPVRSGLDVALGGVISKAMGKTWPGRRYFLEVQHDDPDEGWVQIITPSGWPPRAVPEEA